MTRTRREATLSAADAFNRELANAGIVVVAATPADVVRVNGPNHFPRKYAATPDECVTATAESDDQLETAAIVSAKQCAAWLKVAGDSLDIVDGPRLYSYNPDFGEKTALMWGLHAFKREDQRP